MVALSEHSSPSDYECEAARNIETTISYVDDW